MVSTTITDFLLGVLASIIASFIVEAINYFKNHLKNKKDRQGNGDHS